MNKTTIARLAKQLRRLLLEQRAYLSAADSQLYVAKLFPAKSVERRSLETAAQDALAWANEIAIQVKQTRDELETAKIALN